MMKSRVTREITSQDKNNAHKQAMLKAELDQQYKNMQDSNDYAQM